MPTKTHLINAPLPSSLPLSPVLFGYCLVDDIEYDDLITVPVLHWSEMHLYCFMLMELSNKVRLLYLPNLLVA